MLTLHNIKVALRNIIKYKFQNVVSVLAIAVSAMLLTVVWSGLNEITPAEILEQPYADRVYTLRLFKPADDRPGTFTIDFDAMNIVAKTRFKSAERIMAESGDRQTADATVTRDDGQRKRMVDIYQMHPDFLQWWGVRSIITGSPAVRLEKGGLILTERMAKALFGRKNVVGETVELVYYNDESSEKRLMKVLDVVRLSPENRGQIEGDIYVAEDDENRMSAVSNYVELREGFTKDDFIKEMEEALGGYSINYFGRITEDYEMENAIIFPLIKAIIGFLIVFLFVAVTGYMRMQAQLFRIRQREIALRTVVGARRWQLLAQFSVEVLMIIGLAFGLTLLFNSLVRDYFRENLVYILSEIYWPMDNFTQISSMVYGVTALLCLATVWLVIRGIRRRQTGLAMQMRPSRGSGLSIATLSVQVFFSTVLISAALLVDSMVRTQRGSIAIPDNDDFYKECLMLNQMAFNDIDKYDEFYRKLRQSKNIEKMVPFDKHTVEIKVDSLKEKIGNAYMQNSSEMIDFYGLKPEITNPKANPQRHVFVTQKFRKELERVGQWQKGYLPLWMMSGVVDYDIAGTFGQIPYTNGTINDIIVTDAAETFYTSKHIIVPKPGRRSQTLKDVKAAQDEVFGGRLGIEPTNYRKSERPDLDMLDVLRNLFAILAAISVVATVASLYSVISLDTRRRRKEVALRKIHGATASVIARIFARRYVIICAVSYLLLIPVLLIAFNLFYFESIAWWQLWLSTITITTLIVTLTICFKIREVMRLNPAAWMKE